MQETKTERLNIRIDEPLKERLKSAAKAEGRSTASLVIHIIRQWLENNHSIKNNNLSD